MKQRDWPRVERQNKRRRAALKRQTHRKARERARAATRAGVQWARPRARGRAPTMPELVGEKSSPSPRELQAPKKKRGIAAKMLGGIKRMLSMNRARGG